MGRINALGQGLATTAVAAGLAALATLPVAAQSPQPPQVIVGEAGSAKVPVTGSVPNAATADYPTTATADYVFGCMSSNGNTRTALEQCSCSFDVVATLLPYQRYVDASTYLSMGQVTGEKGVLFRSSADAKATVADLRRAQAEAEIRCFN